MGRQPAPGTLASSSALLIDRACLTEKTSKRVLAQRRSTARTRAGRLIAARASSRRGRCSA